MKSALGVIACVVLLSRIAQGQANPSPALQPTPLEAFASLPATHVAWSREVGRLDSTEAHAIVTALTLEDTAQPPDRMSGVRLDLSTENARDQVYLGEETLGAGDAAGFKAGTPDGHHLQNRSTSEALVLEVGTRLPGDGCYYSDIDMMIIDESPVGHTRRDGTPYARRSSSGEGE